MGLNEVPYCPDNGITQRNIGLVSNGLELVFFIRGNADCHDPVAFFWHEGKVGYLRACATHYRRGFAGWPSGRCGMPLPYAVHRRALLFLKTASC